MTDLDALLAEAELRAGDGRAWTGDFESLIEDSELVAALAAAVRELRERHTTALAIIRAADDVWNLHEVPWSDAERAVLDEATQETP